MHYLLDELHAYEHDYSGALRRVPLKNNPSLAGDRALYAPASRKELASFQTSVLGDIKDVRGALTNLDAKVGRIEDMLQCLTEAVTGARQGPVPTPLSGGHPTAYPTLSGEPLWFFCFAADR